jgi:hypothetical protein
VFVTAVSTPDRPRWRWRITSYAGDVIDESHDDFATITAALHAGRTRAADMEKPPAVEAEETETRQTWRQWRYGRRTSMLVAALVLVAGIAHADVPTAKDFAECNREAREGRRDRGASPNQKDHDGAKQARSAGSGAADQPGTAREFRSEDSQVAGIDAAGETDPEYRAAYRVCMRKKGF